VFKFASRRLMTNGQHATGYSGARNAIHKHRHLLCF
jgi:hypothetical protein